MWAKKRADMQLFMIFFEKSYASDPLNVLSLVQLLQYVIGEECMALYDYANLRKVS